MNSLNDTQGPNLADHLPESASDQPPGIDSQIIRRSRRGRNQGTKMAKCPTSNSESKFGKPCKDANTGMSHTCIWTTWKTANSSCPPQIFVPYALLSLILNSSIQTDWLTSLTFDS